MRIASVRSIVASVLPILIVLWAQPGFAAVEKKAKTEDSAPKAGDAKKGVPDLGKSAGKAAVQGKAAAKSASGAVRKIKGAGKGKANTLAQETAKHLKRMALIDRLAKVRTSDDDKKRIATMRANELQRHERAVARLGGAKGAKAVDAAKKKVVEPAKKVVDEAKKTGKKS